MQIALVSAAVFGLGLNLLVKGRARKTKTDEVEGRENRAEERKRGA